MARVCDITGAHVTRGKRIHRKGLAKKKKGVGRHVTKEVTRTFTPNLQKKRIYVPELDQFIQLKVTARALKTMSKNGVYKTLKAAGIVE